MVNFGLRLAELTRQAAIRLNPRISVLVRQIGPTDAVTERRPAIWRNIRDCLYCSLIHRSECRLLVGSIQYGWITGYSDGTFRPENTITRAEVTTIVNRMLGRSADRTFIAEHADELRSFSDVTTSHWSYYAVMEATNAHDFTKDNGVETWNGLSD